MIIVTNAAGLIVMWTEKGNPAPPQGGASHTLTTEQEITYAALNKTPNGGVTFINGAFTALPPGPAPVLPNAGGNALMERRARALDRVGTVEAQLAAVKLRMGE